MKKIYWSVFIYFSLTVPVYGAVGICPEINSHRDSYVKRITNSNYWRYAIYFCKQTFSDIDLTYAPSEYDLINGNSRNIPQGRTFQIRPVGNSVNLTGFTPTDLNLNNLRVVLPNRNGVDGSPSVFNFYQRTSFLARCDGFFFNHYSFIRDYLRNNPRTFEFKSGGVTQNFMADRSNATSLLKIENAKLSKSTGETIKANVYLFHANNKAGQFFTRGITKYCWYGVAARVEINPQAGNLTYAGNYDFTIRVNTK